MRLPMLEDVRAQRTVVFTRFGGYNHTPGVRNQFFDMVNIPGRIPLLSPRKPYVHVRNGVSGGAVCPQQAVLDCG